MSSLTFNDPWYLQRKFRSIIKSSAVALLVAPAAMMAADGIQVAGDMCRVYMVHDGGLNNSQMLVVDIPVAHPDADPLSFQPFKAELYGPLLPGFDLEAMDIRTDDKGANKGLYVASGDDTNSPGTVYLVVGGSPVKIGKVCDLKDPNTGEVVVEGCVAEIDGISFAPGSNCMLGWAQDVGLFQVCLNNAGTKFVAGSAELLIPAHGEFEDITWNMDGTVLYAVENDWSFNNPDQFFDYASNTTDYTSPGTGTHPYFHIGQSYYQPDPSMQGDAEANTKLWRYDSVSGAIQEVCASEIDQLKASCDKPVEIEALDAIPSPKSPNGGGLEPGDTLAIGYHRCSNDIVNLIRLNIDPDTLDCSVEQTEEVQVDFSVLKEAKQNTPADIEGIAWPCNPWPVADPCITTHYAKDAADDSTAVPEPVVPQPVSSPIIIGDTDYEIYGLGFEQSKDEDNNRITIAVNANMTLASKPSNNTNILPNVAGSAKAGERYINFGDFLIEITKDNDEIEYYGIHFVANNDAPLPGANTGIGLYQITDHQFVSNANYPWMSFYEYNEYLISKGHTPSLAHVGMFALGMFDSAPIAINPAGAVKISDVTVLANKTEVGTASNLQFTPTTLDALQGLFFGNEYNDGEENTFGVSFDMPAEWAGAKSIQISLFVECANDGIVLTGDFCPETEDGE